MATVCIICQNEAGHGEPVRDTQVIVAIRSLKQKLGMATGNKLMVCESCLGVYGRKRKEFEGRTIQYGVLGALVLLVLAGMPLLGGQFNLVSILVGLVLALVIWAASLVDYTPPLEDMDALKRHQEREALMRDKAAREGGPRPENGILDSILNRGADRGVSAPKPESGAKYPPASNSPPFWPPTPDSKAAAKPHASHKKPAHKGARKR